MSADDVLLGAQLAEETVPVCTRGDLVGQYRRLDRELAQAKVQAAADPRLAGGDIAEKARRLAELREQIDAATVQFRLRALGRRWRKLVDEHPPRKGRDGTVHEDDRGHGVNIATFFPALIRASVVEPKLRDETWDQLLDPDSELLSEAQYRQLRDVAWRLNLEAVDIPFSLAGLLTSPTSDSESGSPEPSA